MLMNESRKPPVPTPCPIAISEPDLTKLERDYLLAAFDSSWISSTGTFVSRFESGFAEFTGASHAISCANGSCALHLALLALGIGPGDEVIVPDLTYVATANAVRYVGAEPVIADCDPRTWTVDPKSVARLITGRTRAIIPVHLLGTPADMTALTAIAKQHGIFVVEDAAEAHGATHAGHTVGSLSDLSVFSFYGNKILSTGEGGMVCTSSDDLAARVRKFRCQGVDPKRHYWFDTVGYNYRLSNLACAIGLAQLERFNELCASREKVRAWYNQALAKESIALVAQQIPPDAAPVLWIYGVVLDEAFPADRDFVRAQLDKAQIETRPLFPPMSSLPIYRDCRTDRGCPVARRLGRRGIMLPTHTRLTRKDVQRIVDQLSAIANQRLACIA